jgi:hypothetical protein
VVFSISLLANACGDVAVWLTANPEPTLDQLRVIVDWLREAHDQTGRDHGDADSYEFERSCYLAAVDGKPDALRNIAGTYLALTVCRFEEPAYEALGAGISAKSSPYCNGRAATAWKRPLSVTPPDGGGGTVSMAAVTTMRNAVIRTMRSASSKRCRRRP